MSDRPSKHVELLLLCGRVRDDALTPEDAKRLDALLQDNDQAKALYVRYMSVLSLMESRGASQSAAEADSSDSIDHDVFSELLQLEEQAEAELVHDVGQLGRSKSPMKLNGALRWVIEHPAIWSAAAAAIAIAVVLAVVFTGDPDPSSVAVDPSDPTDAIESHAVATLTASQNATWASASLAPGSGPRPGDALAAGQRLNLTAGFAEITTNRGAIAILEAPATVELLDNNNALRLHSGKLVGICETESSKGFLVRTPHMDITDLGTRFGVDASDQDATEVHVFEGSVQVSRSVAGSGSTATEVLGKGRAMRADASSDGFVGTEIAADRFARRPGNLLAGTGQGQAEGEIANHWRVVAVDGQPVTQDGGLILVPEHHGGTSDPNTSQWLKINDALNPPGKGSAVFTCRSSFSVPESINPQTHALVIRCEADFSVKAVRVNGQALKVPNNRIGNGWITLTVTDQFAPGENTIEVDVQEYFTNNGKGNSSSLRVEIEARRP